MSLKSARNLSFLAISGLIFAGCFITTPEEDDDKGKKDDSSVVDDDDDDTTDDDDDASAGTGGQSGDDESAGSSGDEGTAGSATAGAAGEGDEGSAGAAGEGDEGSAGAAGEGSGGAAGEGSGGMAGAEDAAGAGGDDAAAGASGEAGSGGSGGQAIVVATSDLAQVTGATFTEGGRPNTTDSTKAPTVDSPANVINGGTATYTVGVVEGDVSILIGLEGDNGYFTLPVPSTDGGQSVNITLLQGYDKPNLGVLIATVDDSGEVSSWTSKSIPVTETLTGELKISLSFDADVDLDLHVFAPGDEHLYFSEKTSESGGELDLDSNAGCTISDVNNENVTWVEGTAPDGEYRVAVDYYRACSMEDPVNYIVTVTIGDVVTTYEGIATADQADSDWSNTIEDVVTFTYGS